jgi:hypothetical protein
VRLTITFRVFTREADASGKKALLLLLLPVERVTKLNKVQRRNFHDYPDCVICCLGWVSVRSSELKLISLCDRLSLSMTTAFESFEKLADRLPVLKLDYSNAHTRLEVVRYSSTLLPTNKQMVYTCIPLMNLIHSTFQRREH